MKLLEFDRNRKVWFDGVNVGRIEPTKPGSCDRWVFIPEFGARRPSIFHETRSRRTLRELKSTFRRDIARSFGQRASL